MGTLRKSACSVCKHKTLSLNSQQAHMAATAATQDLEKQAEANSPQ